jgi:hypothetical protein
MLLSSSCWVVVRQSLGSHLTVVRQPSGICQAAVRQLSGSWQTIGRKFWGSCQAVVGAVVRQLSGSCQAVVRQLSGSCQAVVRKLSGSWWKNESMVSGDPVKKFFGKQGTGKGTNRDIPSGDRRGHSPITIIFRGWKGDNPRLSPFSGAGRGRHFQWFCPLYFKV